MVELGTNPREVSSRREGPYYTMLTNQLVPDYLCNLPWVYFKLCERSCPAVLLCMVVVVWVTLPSSGSVRRGGAVIQQAASKWDVRVDLNMFNTFIEITFLHFAGV